MMRGLRPGCEGNGRHRGPNAHSVDVVGGLQGWFLTGGA